jgi:intraflagellar transport protein 122
MLLYHYCTGGADNTVVIWKITGQGLLKYNHTAPIQKVKYCPSILQLVSCSEVDFGIWNPDQKQVVKEKVPSKILSAAWSVDGSILALGLLNGWIMLRDSHGQELHRIERRAPIWCLQFISGGGTAPITLGNKGNGSPNNPLNNVDTDLLVVGCWDKTLSLYK